MSLSSHSNRRLGRAIATLLAPIAGAVLCAGAHAQSLQRAETLEEVVVKGQLIRSEDSAYSAVVLSNDDVRDQGYADIDELFRLVPGMAVRDLQLGTVANSIVIRGFGGGGHGGDLGAVVDGIPLNEAMSHADGYVDLNVIVPLEIDSLTVLKGPVSALYGNFNRGGLVNIQTRKTGNYAETDLSLGSHETTDLQAAYGSAVGERQQVNVAAQLYRTDGYRPQSDTERSTASARWAYDATDDLQIALSGRFLESDSRSASYITRAQFAAGSIGIDPRTQNDGAEKDFLTLRADANYQISPDLKLLTFAYTTEQDFTRWFTRPINAATWRQREETYDRTVHGAGTSLNGLLTLASVPVRYVAGVEAFRESTQFKFFDGLNRRQRVTPALSDRDTKLNSISAFTEVEASLHPLAKVSLGLRADRFTGGCERLGPETGTDPCAPLNRANHVSPKLGLTSQVTDWLQLRASWAEGFALPNGFVKYSIGGQPLDENVFKQTEVGAHVSATAALEFDIAAYRLSSTGEVRTVSPGVFENFGATLRRGVEASALWRPVEAFELRAVYGLTDTEVKENADTRLLGLSVAGVPDETASLDASFMPFAGWAFTTSWRYVGEYEVDAFNVLAAESYDVLDLGVSYTHSGARSFRVYGRIDNVTDRTYATTTSLIGGQEVLAPGAPRAFRTGIQFNF